MGNTLYNFLDILKGNFATFLHKFLEKFVKNYPKNKKLFWENFEMIWRNYKIIILGTFWKFLGKYVCQVSFVKQILNDLLKLWSFELKKYISIYISIRIDTENFSILTPLMNVELHILVQITPLHIFVLKNFRCSITIWHNATGLRLYWGALVILYSPVFVINTFSKPIKFVNFSETSYNKLWQMARAVWCRMPTWSHIALMIFGWQWPWFRVAKAAKKSKYFFPSTSHM